MNHTITGELNAYISPYSLISPLDVGDDTDVDDLFFALSMPDGYIRVGTAQVTVTLFEKTEIVRDKITALRSELQTVRANAQLKAKEIEGEISKLMAITNEVPHECA